MERHERAQAITAAIQTAAALGDTIRALGSVPSGHLYAQVMGHMSLDSYQGCITLLKQAELVEEKNHLLTWVGPSK